MNKRAVAAHWARRTALGLCAALLGGCATRADLLQLKQDQRETRALVADQQVAIEGLRRRVEIVRGEMTDSGRGKRGTALSADSAQQMRDLEARLAILEQARALGPQPAEAGAAAAGLGEVNRPLEPQAPPTKAQTPLEVALAKEEAAAQTAPAEYREGLALVRQGQCNQAVPKLRDFIRRNAKTEVADNAQYWIGSCYYSQKDYNRAIIELNEVVLKYPKADKVPGALSLLADSFADSGDKIDARLILQKLISDHPRSEEAERARQKLQSLGE